MQLMSPLHKVATDSTALQLTAGFGFIACDELFQKYKAFFFHERRTSTSYCRVAQADVFLHQRQAHLHSVIEPLELI